MASAVRTQGFRTTSPLKFVMVDICMMMAVGTRASVEDSACMSIMTSRPLLPIPPAAVKHVPLSFDCQPKQRRFRSPNCNRISRTRAVPLADMPNTCASSHRSRYCSHWRICNLTAQVTCIVLHTCSASLAHVFFKMGTASPETLQATRADSPPSLLGQYCCLGAACQWPHCPTTLCFQTSHFYLFSRPTALP